MPKPIFTTDHSDTEGSILERVLGTSQRQRSTKTWFPSTALVQRMAVLRQHSKRLLAAFRALHLKTHPEVTNESLTDDDLRRLYPCIGSYEGLHQELAEHLGSYKGFTLRTVMGESPDMEGKPKRDSSAGVEPASKATPTQPPANLPQEARGGTPNPGMAMR